MIPVIDLFAGPGGLSEGFSSLLDEKGQPIFQTIMSIERDPEAYKTLRLRSYVRKIMNSSGSVPAVYNRYLQEQSEENFEALISFRPELWEEAGREAVCAELKDGDNTYVKEGRKRLKEFRAGQKLPWVLIGGPPCQAYSIVGRARRAHDETLEDDVKQTLYRCYLAFIHELKPTVFVMENVKGLLSAQRKGEGVFQRIIADMENEGYEIRSLVKKDPKDPRDYVVKAEEYGVPQARHRVILLGIRKTRKKPSGILVPSEAMTLREAFKGIPKLSSGLSFRSSKAGVEDWVRYIDGAIDKLLETDEGHDLEDVLLRVRRELIQRPSSLNTTDGKSGRYHGWYRKALKGRNTLANHETRTHLAADLDRYLFCAAYAEKYGVAPHIADFPRYLYPNHKNVQNLAPGQAMKFSDRFRVQTWDSPSTTITSHISKDGHYYIHPDPEQCRSLTVREAARLQTFPDDYLFEGNRTSQYTQVGNAVPPLLAQQIAAIVADYLNREAHGFCDGLAFLSDDR